VAKQEGIGKILKDGIVPAAEKIGRDSIEFAIQHRNMDPFPGGIPYQATMGAYVVPAAQEIWIHPPAADGQAAYPLVAEESNISFEEAEKLMQDWSSEFAEKYTGDKDAWREENYKNYAKYAFTQENIITAMDIRRALRF